MAGWFPAYDIRLMSYGLGVIHHLYVIKHASESGIRLFDFGAGEESYKRTFSDYDLTVAKGALSRRSAVAGIRRMQTAPTRLATAFVLNHPSLRVAARNTLNFLGGVRARLHRR
jgi:CelD/BcsL family acetyltransferase involved in cellulose biosynthesis